MSGLHSCQVSCKEKLNVEGVFLSLTLQLLKLVTKSDNDPQGIEEEDIFIILIYIFSMYCINIVKNCTKLPSSHQNTSYRHYLCSVHKNFRSNK